MNTPSDLSIQKFLAEQLPDLIEMRRDGRGNEFPAWDDEENDLYHEVTRYEWEGIVREVENKLTEKQKRELNCELHKAAGVDFYVWDLLWQIHGIALAKILGKKITE